MNSIDFGYWLQAERDNRGWSQSDLARYSGLHRAVISKIESGTKPMPDTLSALAKAFNISPVVLFRKAGLLPDGGDTARFEDWAFLLQQLPPEDQAELRQIAELKIERRKKEQALKTLHTKKA